MVSSEYRQVEGVRGKGRHLLPRLYLDMLNEGEQPFLSLGFESGSGARVRFRVRVRVSSRGEGSR